MADSERLHVDSSESSTNLLDQGAYIPGTASLVAEVDSESHDMRSHD